MPTEPKLTQEQSFQLDALILANEKLKYIALFQKLTGCSLAEAVESLNQRYQALRANDSSKFKISDADYWHGFYS